MTTARLWASVAVCFLWASAIFVWDGLEAAAKRVGHWLACAWMQCDEVRG